MRTLSASLFEKRTRGFHFLLGVLVSVAPGFAAEGPAKSKLEDFLKQLHYEAIPFRLNEDNKPLIKGELSGKKTTFLLDTGWGITTVNTKVGARLKSLGDLGVELDDNVLGRLTNSSIVLMDNLTLSGARFLNQPARVQKLRMDLIALSYEAILGCDFFCRNFCLVDCSAGRLYARASERSAEQTERFEESLRRSGFVEASSQTQLALTIDSNVNGKSAQLLVDTGGFVSVLDDSQVERLSLKYVRDNRPGIGSMIPDELNGVAIGMGKIGAHQLKVTRLKTFEIGSKEWPNTSFGVASLKSWGIGDPDRAGKDLHGLLGMDFLAAHGALIDFSSLKIWLRPESKPSAKK